MAKLMLHMAINGKANYYGDILQRIEYTCCTFDVYFEFLTCNGGLNIKYIGKSVPHLC